MFNFFLHLHSLSLSLSLSLCVCVCSLVSSHALRITFTYCSIPSAGVSPLTSYFSALRPPPDVLSFPGVQLPLSYIDIPEAYGGEVSSAGVYVEPSLIQNGTSIQFCQISCTYLSFVVLSVERPSSLLSPSLPIPLLLPPSHTSHLLYHLFVFLCSLQLHSVPLRAQDRRAVVKLCISRRWKPSASESYQRDSTATLAPLHHQLQGCMTKR